MAERKQHKIISRVVLFDGVCNLCNATIQKLIEWDKNQILKFASLQSDFGQRLLQDLGEDSNDFKSFIYLRENQVYTQSTAAIELLSDLSNSIKWARILYIVPKFLRDWFYRIIAKNRYNWFGKKESCWLPTKDLEKRFLD